MHEQRIGGTGAANSALLDRSEPAGAAPGKRTLTSELEQQARDRAVGPVQPVPTAPEQPKVAQPKDGGTPAPTPTGPAPTPTGPAPTPTGPAPTPTGTPAGPGTSIAAAFNATRIAFPSAPAFGEVDWNAHEPTATYAAYRDGANWRFRLETLALRVPVGVSSGGRTNVPSAADPVVTSATWRTVASDLTPGGGTPNRSPRTTYWAEDLTLTHEIFHFNEFNTFLRTSFGSFETTIEGAGYTEAATATGDTEAAALGRKAADLHTRLLAAWNQAKTNMAPGMEDRAYDDGAANYQARADAVRARAATAGWT
jgi:hypothetical protein